MIKYVPYEQLSQHYCKRLQQQIIQHGWQEKGFWGRLKWEWNHQIGSWWRALWWRRGIRFVKIEIHAGKVWRYYKHVKTESAGCWLRTEKIRIWVGRI